MITAWMLGSALFGACLGVAALAAERVQRARGATAGRWGTRGAWTLALAGAVLWPAVVPMSRAWRAASPASDTAAIVMPGVARATLVSASGESESSWIPLVRETLAAWSGVATVWAAQVQELVYRIDAAGVGVVLLGAWGVCTLLLTVRLVRGARRLHTLTAQAHVTRVDGETVLLTDAFGPATVGWRTPRIVLPSWVRDLDAPLRALVLAHERAHRDARDPRLVWLATLAVAVMPWNPSVWWIARRLRLAIERDCDARTIAAVSPTPAPQAYARLLLFMAQQVGRMSTASSFSSAPLASAMASSRSHLHARIQTMHAPPIDPTSPTARRQRALFGALAVLAVTAACGTRIPGNLTSSAPSDVALGDAAGGSSEVAPVPMPNGMLDTVPLGVPDTVTTPPYFEYQVERPAALRGAMSLRYPTVLRSAGIDGEVLASFVVNEDGRVDTTTFRVLRSDHALFTDAVRTALVNVAYDAAEVGGRRVKQLVQQPFVFALDASSSRRVTPGSSAVMQRSPLDDVTTPRTPGGNALPPSDARPVPVAATGDVHFEYQVEKPAAMRGGAGMTYPAALRAAKVEGTVLASFVVNEDGLVDLSTFTVLRSSDEAFTTAVREALPGMRFTPAELSGRRVKQLVQQPFVFNIAR
jgi:TonB family protein